MTKGPATTRIAFVGTGVMGASMVGHLLDAGYPVTVFNRSRGRAEPLIARGAAWAASAGEAAAAADVVITMVGYPSDVEEVYFGVGEVSGIIEAAPSGSLLIDMTTSSPALAVRIAEKAAQRGLHALDAPVSGGDVGARNATLSIMVGGAGPAFDAALPIFEVLGKTVVRQGGPGCGQHAKMANQIAVAGSMFAMVELLGYVDSVGLDPETVLSSVTGGAAASWSLSNLAPRVLKGDLAPGFYVKHFVKDLRIAVQSAEESGAGLPMLQLAKQLYERLESAGGGDYGTQALWLLYADEAARDAAGVERSVSANGKA